MKMPRDEYIKNVQKEAIRLYKEDVIDLNEEEKGDYPDPLGKKFKPKSQMPKKKRKPQSVVNIKEDDGNTAKHGMLGTPETDYSNTKEEYIPLMKGIADDLMSNADMVNKTAQDMGYGNFLSNNYENYAKYVADFVEEYVDSFNDITALSQAVQQPNNEKVLYGKFIDYVNKGLDDVASGEMGLEENTEDAPEIDIEDVTTAKEATGDQLEGGLGDDKLPNQFDPEQVAMGVKVEMEHTDNPLLAVEIALDHLTEIPDYYTRLDNMEKEAGVEHHDEETGEETGEETTDELLGFKPHNVGDYANEEFDVPASPEQERDYWDKEYYKQDQEKEMPSAETGFPPKEWVDKHYTMDYKQDGPKFYDKDGNHVEYVDIVKHWQNSGEINEYGEEPQGIDWQEFYTMSKDTSGYNPEYEQKYGNQLDKPHIVDALDNSEDFNSFMRRIKDFEDINEYVDMGMEEYRGEVGDRYRDSEGNEFAVSDITKGGVVLRGYGGSKEVGTGELKHMEKLNEDVELARQVLKNRRLNEGMTKEDAVRLLVRHNIK
jgi:hypothetical protein